MPLYRYRGMTDKGQIVSNRLDAENKQVIVQQLKENGITPIEITSIGLKTRRKTQRRNMAQAKDIFKEVNMAKIKTVKESKERPKSFDKIKKRLLIFISCVPAVQRLFL